MMLFTSISDNAAYPLEHATNLWSQKTELCQGQSIANVQRNAALSPGISNPTLDNDFRAPHLLRFRAPAALQTSTARDHWYCLIDVKIQKVQLVEVKHQEC